MRSGGKIEDDDWRLFMCDPVTGLTGLTCWGGEDEAMAELKARAAKEQDVWLVDPSGKTVTA